MCSYLNAAAISCAGENAAAWLVEQKDFMKQSCHPKVLQALAPHVEKSTTKDSDTPVRACYRYIQDRPDQLDYKTALENDLPIGSGGIESAHRYVIQKRLKIVVWWQLPNAEQMLQLRIYRANGRWENYWKKVA